MNPESVLSVDAQGGIALDGSRGMPNRPELNVVKGAPVPNVPIRDFRNQIKHSSVTSGAEQLNVFGMCPQQRYSPAGRTATLEILLRAVVFVPDLLWDEMSGCGEAFHPADVLRNLPARSQFIMAS